MLSFEIRSEIKFLIWFDLIAHEHLNGFFTANQKLSQFLVFQLKKPETSQLLLVIINW